MRYQIELERRTSTGLNYLLGTGFAGKDYNPALGFEDWKNYRMFTSRLEYNWLAKKSSPIYKISVKTEPYAYINNETKKYDVINLNLPIHLGTKSGYSFEISNSYSLENVNDSVKYLKKVVIPPGNYKYFYFRGQIFSPFTSPFAIVMDFKIGSFYDGYQQTFAISPIWNMSKIFRV
ncbi:MAG: hypothetical protein HC831_30925 [Chloroflexia bacterium]|nr:hypothetical protein [Chloroflexia bacterium]